MTDEAPCPNYREWLTAWVDGELRDLTQLEALEAHVGGCEGCRIYAEAEAATKRLLATTYTRPVEVGTLLAQVRARLDRVTVPKRRRMGVGVPTLAWGALAAVLLVAIAVGSLMLRPEATVEASPLLQAVVTEHVECMLGRLPLELTTTDLEEVSRWLRERVARPVALPPLAPEHQTEMSTRRARLAQADGIQILVERDGRMHSVFIMRVRELSGRLGRRVTRAGRDFLVNELEGYTVVFWRQGDLLYCLVSDGGDDDVVSLAAMYADSSSEQGT